MPESATSKVNQGVPLPSTAGEIITTVAHFHRAEIARMGSWRDRIDRTSNWAITVVAAMSSVALSAQSAHHGVIIFAMMLCYLLLRVEARRYRFFDVYRARVRQFERHYFAQIFSPAADYAANWQHILGTGLREPRFRISYADALSRRLRRNYVWIFVLLLLAWLQKISTASIADTTGSYPQFMRLLEDAIAAASLGLFPGWLTMMLIAGFYAYLLYCYLRPMGATDDGTYSEVHV